jgi:hypothetical protein
MSQKSLRDSIALSEQFRATIRPYQQQARQYSLRYLACDALGLRAHLHLPQMQSAFQFLYHQHHTPTLRIFAANRSGAPQESGSQGF